MLPNAVKVKIPISSRVLHSWSEYPCQFSGKKHVDIHEALVAGDRHQYSEDFVKVMLPFLCLVQIDFESPDMVLIQRTQIGQDD